MVKGRSEAGRSKSLTKLRSIASAASTFNLDHVPNCSRTLKIVAAIPVHSIIAKALGDRSWT